MRNLTSYELHTGKLKKPVIFGVVSDLHDEPYDDLWPLLAGCDALLVPGDVVNRYTQTSARGIAFLREAARRMPTFFSLGNHETKTKQFQALMQALNGTGAEILVNRYVPFGACWIGGWYDPEIVRQPDCMDEFERLPGCRVLLCLNKCDLDPAQELYDSYAASAIPVLRVSAATGEGLPELRRAMKGKLNALTGNSGVGKSSILNAMEPVFGLPVGEVSKALGRGRHTTRHVEMFPLDEDTYVIDTPGFSSFDTEELDLELKARLPETFPEFAPYLGQCRFVGCSHVKEKGCAVLQAVKDGRIPASRHRSYVRLYDELKDLRDWQHK